MNLSAHTTAASYRSGQPIQSIRPDDTIGFLSALYSNMRGYCELLYAAGHPRDGLSRAGWYWIDSANSLTIQTLGLAARELAAQFGDVYISLSLYARRERSLAAVIDTAWLFVDDCPRSASLPYTMALETSKGNYQGFYKASQPIAASQRAALSRSLAVGLAADPSGADLTQVVRVPGTFNTKRPDSWPVALVSYNLQPLPLDALLAAYPTAAMQLDARAALDALDASAARWLANINQLVDRDGIPYRVKNPKARSLWAASWPDSSAQRYAFAVSLVMHGYVDCEAAAILAHCAASPTAIRKGQSWHAADIYRCLAKARAAYPSKRAPSPTLPTKRGQLQLQLQNQPIVSTLAASLPAKPKPVGRASKVTAAQLLAFYQREADTATHCLMSRAEVAAALGCSQRLIAALDQELASSGRARREVSKDRAFSWVVLADESGELEGGDRDLGHAEISVQPANSGQPEPQPENNLCTTKNSEFSASQSDRADDSNLDVCPISNTPPNKNPKTKTSPSSSPVGCQPSHDCADLPSSQPSPIPQSSSQLASRSPVPTPRRDFDEKSEPNTFVLDSEKSLVIGLNQALTLKKSEPNTFVLDSVFDPKAAQRDKSAAAAAAALSSATKAALAGDRGLMLAWLGKYSQLAASSRLGYDAGLVESIHGLLRTASSA